MADYHVIAEGESLAGLAKNAGFTADVVWRHPKNKSLLEQRSVPMHLVPGDRVFIPDIGTKTESGSTGARHTFRLKNSPAKYRAKLFGIDGKPRANERYTITVGFAEHKGVTDAKGFFEVPIPPNAPKGILVMESDGWTLHLSFGTMRPYDTIEGAQMRLGNLGYFYGEVTGELDQPTRLALIRFQVDVELPVSTELDDKTINKLRELHDVKNTVLPTNDNH